MDDNFRNRAEMRMAVIRLLYGLNFPQLCSVLFYVAKLMS